MKSIITSAALAGILIAFPGVASAQEMIVASGEFRDADAVHTGSGTAQIAKTTDGSLELQLVGFETIAGPDLKVWLVEAAEVRTAGDVTSSSWLSLGALESASGDQSYAIPDGTDVSAYQSAVIWCETYSVLFTAADLTAN